MSDVVTIFGSVPEGRRLEAEPERPAGRFGTLRPATDELRTALRRNGVREIPDDQLERHVGGRYWTDHESNQELELVRGHVDPATPAETGCIAFAVRDGYIVPFKARGDQGRVKSVPMGSVGGGRATEKERVG